MNFVKTLFASLVLILIFLSSVSTIQAAKNTLNYDVINHIENNNIAHKKESSSSFLEHPPASFMKVQESTGSEQDSLILVGFVFSDFFDGRFWTIEWDLSQPMDTWVGVTLNEDRRVIGLELINRNINAQIPANFGNLSELKTLIIEDEDDIDGFLPKELGNLTKLEVLRIKNTKVTGPIPAAHAQLTSLQVVDLSDNLIYGPIPEEIGNLTQLTELRLSNNQFTGDLPESMSNLTSLQVLDISENRFTYLPDMTAVSPGTFNVQRNRLTFESLLPNFDILDTYIPQDSLGTTHSINLIAGESFILDLRMDEEVPDNVYTWFKDGVEILQTNEHTFTFENVADADEGVYTCAVTNPGVPGLTLFCRPVTLNVANSCTERDSLAVLDILNAVGTPRSLFNFDLEQDPLEEWKWITLDENRCVASLSISVGNDIYLTERTDGKGYISPAIGDLTNLRRLQIYDIAADEAEGIYGTLPPEIGKLVNLDTLLIWGNYLSGEIPVEFSNLTNLRQLWLSIERLSGEIPDFIGTFTDLRYLDLGHNLTGEIPLSFQNLSLLEWFSLSRNQFTGNIPEIFGNMSNLRGLFLSDNQLSGTVPDQIWNLTQLSSLSLARNQLSGTIPEGLGNLTELLFLQLENNQFEGNIPSSLGNLTKLRNLFVNDNQFTGPIPEGIGNLLDMNYFYLNNNQLSGTLPESLGNLDESLLYIHLENNQLSGEIPDGIENLTGVFDFYAHNNQLSGEIPSGFGNMERLRILSLNDNQLSGALPRELGNPENLSVILLGDNQLSGAVPFNLGKMNRLVKLHLQNNQFTGIENGFAFEDPEASLHIFNFRIENNLLTDLPDLTGMEFMKNDTTSVLGNLLTFEDILPNMGLIEGAFQPRFYYAPQDSIGEELEVKLNQGDNYTIDLGIDEDIEDNNYQWFRDGAGVQTTNVNMLALENLTAEDAGVYTAEVTNPGVPDLTLFSRPVAIIINAPPVFNSTPVTEATVGTGYVYDITASDPDGDALTITATTLPTWVELTDNGDGTATLQGTPQVADCSNQQIMLIVEDENGLSSDQSFEINIAIDLLVSLVADKTAVCEGEAVTFTATLSETVDNSVFTWVVNDETVEGEVASNFTTSALENGDVVKVKVSAESAACIIPEEIESNSVSISVGENFTMSVTIQTDRTPVCQEEEVTFTAELTNAGPNPQFVWKVNDISVGEDASTFTTDALNEGDVVSVEVVTDASTCITNTIANAEVTMTVTDQLTLAVILTADKTGITAGETVNFTASTDYTSSALQYEWFINDQGVNGKTAATFATNTLQNNDKVKVKIIAEPVDCLVQTEAESEEITIIVNENNAVFVQDFDQTLDEDAALTLSANDFISAFSASSSLATIRITALPSEGVLSLNGANISVNQEIEVNQLSGLGYTPDPDVNGEDTFSWNGSDGSSFAANDAKVNITINPVNDPPVFSTSGDVTVVENFNTVEAVTVTPGIVPSDETNQLVTYQLIPLTVSFANITFDTQSGRVAITSIAAQTGQQEFEIIANDRQVVNNTHIESFVLSVQPANAFPPNDIAVDNLSVPENQPVGTMVGTITVNDDDPNDRHVLTLDGNGPDNAFFQTDGNQLKTNASLDFETQNTFQISIRATDLGGNFLEERFTVTVTDVNDLPTALTINATEVRENDPIGVQVGALSAEDQDADDALVFSLINGIADNTLFSINENQLVTNTVFDFEEKSEYEIRIRVEDASGEAFEGVFTISVIDIEPEEIAVISGFTPDNDRMNDTWEIPGLTSYPECTVEVYNSWGHRIFFSKGYQQSWDGTYENRDIPVGTYYYIIDLKNGEPPITGDITVMR